MSFCTSVPADENPQGRIIPRLSGRPVCRYGRSYDLNGDGINDVCVISGEAGNEPGVTYIVLDDSKYSLENGTTGRLLYTVGRNFEEKRYLRPIPKTALNINPDLGQNYYWR